MKRLILHRHQAVLETTLPFPTFAIVKLPIVTDCVEQRCHRRRGSTWLPADLDHARWCEIGANLWHLERAIAWWIGDWWAFGEHRHGARREITEDPDWRGSAIRPAPAAALCRAFEISRRREVPSFSHHAAVVALVPVKQDTLLDQVEREGAPPVIERMREAQAMLSQIV
jgi:hypothetical protein